MRQFPREIEADLLFRGIDIGEWHRGEMSSRRLLCLIDALPDDSAYWRERRDGDWSWEQYMTATLINEVRLSRADNAAIHAGHKMDINLVESPAEAREQEKLADRQRSVREHVLAQMKKAKNHHLAGDG